MQSSIGSGLTTFTKCLLAVLAIRGAFGCSRAYCSRLRAMLSRKNDRMHARSSKSVRTAEKVTSRDRERQEAAV